MKQAFAAVGRCLERCNSWLAAADTSRFGSCCAFAAVVALAIWCTIPLVDPIYDFSFEADSSDTISLSSSLANAVMDRDLQHVPTVRGHPPYFDGPFFLYAIVGLFLRLGEFLHLFRLDFLTTNDGWMIFAIRNTNAVLVVVSSVLFQKTVKLLSGSNFLALALGVLYVVNPQTAEIDLMRVDHLLMPCFLLVAYLTLALIDDPSRRWLPALLGIAMAMLFQTKMNAAMLGVFPVTALVLLYWMGRLRFRQIATLATWFGIVTLLLLARYFYSHKTVVAEMKGRLAEMRLWYERLPVEPLTYFNIEYFANYGSVFLVVFVVSLVTLAFSLTRKFSISGWAVVTTLLAFSALGLAMPKMPRWGIHFVPVYLWVIALGLGWWGRQFQSWSWAGRIGAIASVGLAAILLVPIDALWTLHRRVVVAARQRQESVQVTRLQPRRWFQQNAKPGTRMAWYGHDFANPPIRDLGLDFSCRALCYPYLRVEEIAAFDPPTFDSLEKSVDVVLLEDFHRNGQLSQLKSLNLTKQWNAWSKFYADLDGRYQRISFKSEFDNYGIREVTIYVMSPMAKVP